MDQSGQYNDQEIQILCELRLKNIPGILVNTTLLNDEIQKLAKPIDMESILVFVKHLDRTDLTDEQRIFRFDETKLIVGDNGTKPNTATVVPVPTVTVTTEPQQ